MIDSAYGSSRRLASPARYLVAVADLKGFRRAAEACDVAQPSLSMQVALAERQLGVQIFERDSERPPLGRRHGHCRAGPACPARRARTAGPGPPVRRSVPRHAAARRHSHNRPYLLPEITPALAEPFRACSCCGPRPAPAISCTSSRKAGSTASCSRSRPTSATSTRSHRPRPVRPRRLAEAPTRQKRKAHAS